MKRFIGYAQPHRTVGTHNIALTTGNNLFNHRADTLEMFCEKLFHAAKFAHIFDKNNRIFK